MSIIKFKFNDTATSIIKDGDQIWFRGGSVAS